MVMKNIKLIVLICIGLNYGGFGHAQSRDVVTQKKELEQIKQEIDGAQKNLDSLRNVEKKVLKEISDYEQKANINKTVLDRLTNQLSGLRRNIDHSKGQLETAESSYNATKGRYISNLTHYYSATRNPAVTLKGDLALEKEYLLRKIYLKALSHRYRERLTVTEKSWQQAQSDYSGLLSEKDRVDKAASQKKREFTVISSQKAGKEKDLSRVRQKKESEADRLVTLSEAARQMEELIIRLEKERADRERGQRPTSFVYETGNFVSYKGVLTPPAKGTITEGFGWKTDPITKLKSYSPGIKIQGPKSGRVLATAPGVIAYVGNLRGYGNFVIIEHEDGYYSTIAGIGSLYVDKNQIVEKSEVIGVTESGLVKYELRRGKEPVDPVEWVKLESLK